jgi:hypothetical protein
MRGASEYCCNLAFGVVPSDGASSPLPFGMCATEARINVDWVFSDPGARATYHRLRGTGRSAFEAVVGAQAHNARVQDLFRRCQAWTQSYLSQLGEGRDGVTLSNRALTAADCSCISVLPAGVRLFRATNSCDSLEVAVNFTGDILHFSPDPWALSAPGRLGVLGPNQALIIRAPDWVVVNIAGYALRSAVNSISCPTS